MTLASTRARRPVRRAAQLRITQYLKQHSVEALSFRIADVQTSGLRGSERRNRKAAEMNPRREAKQRGSGKPTLALPRTSPAQAEVPLKDKVTTRWRRGPGASASTDRGRASEPREPANGRLRRSSGAVGGRRRPRRAASLQRYYAVLVVDNDSRSADALELMLPDAAGYPETRIAYSATLLLPLRWSSVRTSRFWR